MGKKGSIGVPRLVLASASPRRASLLAQVGIRFAQQAVVIREGSRSGEAPSARVRRLALAKARRAMGTVEEGGVILGADTVVVLGDEVLGKPRDRREAAEMLKRLSGRTHRVLTGLALLVREPAGEFVAVEETRVTFRRLGKSEIAAYVATSEPMDKAGAYGIQGRAAFFVRAIRGDYTNVVGLPLFRLGRLLVQAGWPLLGLAL